MKFTVGHQHITHHLFKLIEIAKVQMLLSHLQLPVDRPLKMRMKMLLMKDALIPKLRKTNHNNLKLPTVSMVLHLKNKLQLEAFEAKLKIIQQWVQ